MCKHLVSVCILENISLRELDFSGSKSLRSRKRRGRKPDSSVSIYSHNSTEIENQAVEQLFNVSDSVINRQEITDKIPELVPQPKKRGPKPKAKPQLTVPTTNLPSPTKIGRPTNITYALEYPAKGNKRVLRPRK